MASFSSLKIMGEKNKIEIMGEVECISLCLLACAFFPIANFSVGLFLLNCESSLYMRDTGSLSLVLFNFFLFQHLFSFSFHSWLLFAIKSLTFTLLNVAFCSFWVLQPS